MSDPIDRIVKGAPPPDVSADQLAAKAKQSTSPSITAPIQPHPPTLSVSSSDPRDALPSSPPQIYLNLLILESSLRLQYLSLRARLRLHLLLVAALTAWILVFTYLLFFRPREDGQGLGGSVYWVLESMEKLCWCGGMVTLGLFWATGMYARGVRWPRRFVSTTNRGLRGFNLKVVVVRSGGWMAEVGSWIVLVLDPMGWVREERINFQVVPKDIEAGNGATGATTREHWNAHAARHGLLEEDLAPGGDALRVLLLPKPFSPDFREGWDTFRDEYWEKENARRAALRALVRAREREVARRDGGWLWWTGWRGWRNFWVFGPRKSRHQLDLERLALRKRSSTESVKGRSKRESLLLKEERSHSRRSSMSSRSSTPGPDGDGMPRRAGEEKPRRGSSARRSRKQGSINEKSRLSATETLFRDHLDLSMTKRSSIVSDLDADSIKAEESPPPSAGLPPQHEREIKSEPVED